MMTTADNDDKNNSHEMLSEFNMCGTKKERAHTRDWLFFRGLFGKFSRTFSVS